MYKVFVNNKAIFLIEKINDFDVSLNDKMLEYQGKENLKQIVKSFDENIKSKNLFLFSNDFEELKNDFFSAFKTIEAAGGIVRNKKNEILFIFRRDKWDLPKGKVEENETIEEAAIREVEEETGLKKLKILRVLPDTFHMYVLNEKWVIKKTYWFEMICNSEQKPIPQTIEEITEVKWFKDDELNQVLTNTFSSIGDLIEKYLGM